MEWWSLASVILSALIAAGVSWFGVSANIRHSSILAARQNWRDELRRLLPLFTSASAKAELLQLRDALVLHLNPYEDEPLVTAVRDYADEPSEDLRRVLITLFAEYLKYDWERAKAEVFYRSTKAKRVASERIDQQRVERDQRNASAR